jgi:hypothetical protein
MRTRRFVSIIIQFLGASLIQSISGLSLPFFKLAAGNEFVFHDSRVIRKNRKKSRRSPTRACYQYAGAIETPNFQKSKFQTFHFPASFSTILQTDQLQKHFTFLFHSFFVNFSVGCNVSGKISTIQIFLH